jgi:hypothetical protein
MCYLCCVGVTFNDDEDIRRNEDNRKHHLIQEQEKEIEMEQEMAQKTYDCIIAWK